MYSTRLVYHSWKEITRRHVCDALNNRKLEMWSLKGVIQGQKSSTSFKFLLGTLHQAIEQVLEGGLKFDVPLELFEANMGGRKHSTEVGRTLLQLLQFRNPSV